MKIKHRCINYNRLLYYDCKKWRTAFSFLSQLQNKPASLLSKHRLTKDNLRSSLYLSRMFKAYLNHFPICSVDAFHFSLLFLRDKRQKGLSFDRLTFSKQVCRKVWTVKVDFYLAWLFFFSHFGAFILVYYCLSYSCLPFRNASMLSWIKSTTWTGKVEVQI